MQTLVRHLFNQGQYECQICHGKDASIAGKALTFTFFEMHDGSLVPVGLVYEGDCNTCRQEIKDE